MAFDPQQASGYLDACLPSFLTDLEELVSIDSGTFDKAGVDRVVDALEKRYRALGAKVERRRQEEYGDILTAELQGAGSGRVLLIGHTDTVYPAGTAAVRPMRIEGDRAYGPGTADMKSGDLAIVYALRALLEQGSDSYGSVTVIHNSDEEIGSPGSRRLIAELSTAADAVLVLEAGRENGGMVSARKGVADVQLTVHGVAAHAGVNHERGRSAALELAHLIVALEGINGTIPGVTLNVGHVEAGGRTNVVPDRAFARLEIRGFERSRMEEAIERVREIVSRRVVPDTDADMELTISHWPMPRSVQSEQLIRLAQSLAARLGFDLPEVATGGASDGNTAAQAGRPVLDGLGPVGGQPHSPGEYIVISSIVPRTALLAGLTAELTRAS